MGLFILPPHEKTPRNLIETCISSCKLWQKESDKKDCHVSSPIFKGGLVEGSDLEYSNLYILYMARLYIDDAIKMVEDEFKSSEYYKNTLTEVT